MMGAACLSVFMFAHRQDFQKRKKKKATCMFSFTHIKSAKGLSGIEAFFWGLLFSSLAGQNFFKWPLVCESGLLNCLSAMLIFACGKVTAPS
jgi:hypothetical protein